MKFGLSERDFQILKTTFYTPLKLLGAEIYIFGSRATGNHKPFSDIDILVCSSEDLDQEIDDFQEKLIESDFSIKADIVLEKNLAESYKESVNKQKIAWVEI